MLHRARRVVVRWGKGLARSFGGLAWLEKALCLLVLASIATAEATPNPMLRYDDVLTTDWVGSDLAGDVVVESAGVDYGCVRLRKKDGTVLGPICNRNLYCMNTYDADRRPNGGSLYRLPKPHEFYVMVCSACYSGCCDCSGTAFTGDGERLDDGPLDRLWLRLDLLSMLSLLFGLVCLVRRLRGSHSFRVHAGLWLGTGIAMMVLWQRMDGAHADNGLFRVPPSGDPVLFTCGVLTVPVRGGAGHEK